MPQAVWTGELSFGLVNIPVKLYSATSPKRVQFHQYEAGTGRRIRYARVPTGPVLDEAPPPFEPESEFPPRVAGAPSTETSGSDSPGPHQEPSFKPGESPARVEEESPSGPEGEWASRAEEESPSGGAREPLSDAEEEAEVPWEEVVKGYEVEPGRVVTVTPDELSAVAPERSRALEVEQFVELREIDPVHFDKSYYLAPQSGSGARPYWLLYEAMESAEKVAIGRFVMRTKEYLAAIRPGEHVLMLETLFYADEVRDPKELWLPVMEESPERELQMARHLIDALTDEWEPDRHRDQHRERLLDLLRSKAGEALVSTEPEEEEAPSSVIDLMKALEASVEEAKRSRAGEDSQSDVS